ncbi:VOC family protein [Chryseolinea sp. T2]|uniref:VOC family protein n=1 Tax=Chryseolinea sp. T2 TaxID=3129255 RepID=UPI0030785C99
MSRLFSYGLWFDHQAEEAANFYTSVFPNSKVDDILYYGKEGFEIHGGKEGTVMLSEFTLCGEKFVAINGGPLFKFNPSLSFFVVFETIQETDNVWSTLLDGGNVLMPYQKYDFSEKYGWLVDKFGLSWQISFGKISDVGQQLTPSLLFVGKQAGRAEDAIALYTSIFRNSKVDGIMKHPSGGSEPEGNVAHAQFGLSGQKFMIMESTNAGHKFEFNEAVSIIINCDTQEEIDYYWNKFTAEGQESNCGWLKDKFGVSWQVDSTELTRMLKDKDEKKVQRVTKAFLQMKKYDVEKLKAAFEGR